jgi:tol-pal system protein YbgF
MRLLCGLVIGAFCLSAAGCGRNDLIVKKQMEMDARLEQLAQGNVAANARITDLANEISDLQRRVKAASADIEAMKPSHDEFKASIDSIRQKLAALTPPAASTPKIELVNREAAPSDRDAVIQDSYMKAFGLFSANRYGEAIEAFEAFVTAHPTSEYAGNAMYWVGECYYSQHNYSRALESFSKMVATYPKGNKVPDAMLKIGYSFVSMNEPEKARAALQSLLIKYPKSQAAAKARERLGRL